MLRTTYAFLGSIYINTDPLHLNESLESLSLQTFAPSEVVIVQDGPVSKECKDVLSSFSKLLPLKLPVLPSNLGLGPALNAGLSVVTSPYVLRFDTDDVYLPIRAEVQLAFHVQNKLDVSYTYYYKYRDCRPPLSRPRRHLAANLLPLKSLLLFYNPIAHPTVAFSSNPIRKIGGYPSVRFYEDYALWIKAMSRSARVGGMPVVTTYIRTSGHLARRSSFELLHGELTISQLLYHSGLYPKILVSLVLIARLSYRLFLYFLSTFAFRPDI